MGQPHKHAELIKAWADGAAIEVKCGVDNWEDIGGSPAWLDFNEYRIKPEPPKYPQTKISHVEFHEIWKAQTGDVIWSSAVSFAIANAAIARAIEDGDVVPAAMLEKVAEAVRSELVAQVASYSTGCANYINGETDLASIIKRVKEGETSSSFKIVDCRSPVLQSGGIYKMEKNPYRERELIASGAERIDEFTFRVKGGA